MEETPTPPAPEPAPRFPLPEPKPGPAVPPNLRWPLEGKMTPPTVPPQSMRERRATLAGIQRGRSRRGYLFGLVAGQLLVVGLIFGGEALLKLRPDLQFDQSPRILVCVGITVGIVLTGVLIGILLLFQGLAFLLRPRGRPFGVAIANGAKRVGRAILSLGLTLVVLGGTAAGTVPVEQWKPEGIRLWERAKDAFHHLAKKPAGDRR